MGLIKLGLSTGLLPLHLAIPVIRMQLTSIRCIIFHYTVLTILTLSWSERPNQPVPFVARMPEYARVQRHI